MGRSEKALFVPVMILVLFTTKLHKLAQVIVVMTLALGWSVGETTLAQDAPQLDSPLPVIELDAVDPAQWSNTTLYAAPGQTIRITNRGAQPHTFVVPQWGMRIELPTLQPVDVVVPDWVLLDEMFEFYCDEPGHADGGMTGTIQIGTADAIKSGLPGNSGVGPAVNAVTLTANDNLTWTPTSLEIGAGQILQVRNPGVIEHHFVVDEWAINETISAGETVLVRVDRKSVV